MSKKSGVFCDVCGKEITKAKRRYKFKKFEKIYMSDRKFYFKARRLDICENCFSRLQIFVKK